MNNKFFLSLGSYCLIFSVILILCSACVSSNEDIIYLNDQVISLNKQVRKLEQEVGVSTSSSINTTSSNESFREHFAKMALNIESLQEETQRLSSRMDADQVLLRRAAERDTTGTTDLKQQLDQLRLQVEKLYEYLKLEYPKSSQIGDYYSTPQSDAAITPPALTTTTVQAGGTFVPLQTKKPDEVLYDSCMISYNAGKFDEAILSFQNFAKQYPSSELADSALFLVGESYMSLRQYEQAILAYQQVIKIYPKGKKVPGATLRQAIAFNEIKDPVSAKLLLNKIINTYPSSSEAVIAKQKLETIK